MEKGKREMTHQGTISPWCPVCLPSVRLDQVPPFFTGCRSCGATFWRDRGRDGRDAVFVWLPASGLEEVAVS